MRGFLVRAAGLFVLAAFCMPAGAAQPVADAGSGTPIRFVSGPFAGVAIRNAMHGGEPLDADTPHAQDDARFKAGGLRLPISGVLGP